LRLPNNCESPERRRIAKNAGVFRFESAIEFLVDREEERCGVLPGEKAAYRRFSWTGAGAMGGLSAVALEKHIEP